MVKQGLLFDETSVHKGLTPLAERLRPTHLNDFVGQKHLLGEGKLLTKAIEADKVFSIILWGPPGSGKTTLAKLIALKTRAIFISISAVTSGIKDVKKIITEAVSNKKKGIKTILFIDEIHRFNKAQQDALLPHVEKGAIILIGATTENPYFELIPPLLSRVKVLKFYPLEEEELEIIFNKAIKSLDIEVEEEARQLAITYSAGDARRLINTLECASLFAYQEKTDKISKKIIKEALDRETPYDKKGDYHYDTISAFIKSLRGSDPDAALYWLAKMINAGEDPRFIARRMLILAAEDIGNAEPLALVIANATASAVEYVGMPEARIILAQCATYLACAPKSNASYLGIEAALKAIKEEESKPVPLLLRNPSFWGAKQMGYSNGYKYPHEYPGHFVAQNYMPDGEDAKIFYEPSSQGQEKVFRKRMKDLWPEKYIKYRRIDRED